MFPGRPLRPARERLRCQTLSSTAPLGASAATASNAMTLALPTRREAGTSGAGSTVIKASLMVSLAISGRPRAGESVLTRVVFPLPGGPDTTTYQPGGHPPVTRPIVLLGQNQAAGPKRRKTGCPAGRGRSHNSAMARIGDYETAPDAGPASWVIAGLRGFAESVLSLVPEGFEAYARIFHPAWNYEPEAPVRWRDIARANGRAAHRMMQWPSITGSYRFCESDGQPGVWDHQPEEGSLPEALVPVLTSVLARHTATPGRCWFAVWDGWGAIEPGVTS